MDNQHRKIAGYRELSQAEIDLMNEIKALGPVIAEVCAKVEQHLASQITAVGMSHDAASPDQRSEQLRLAAAEPEKWLRWARDGMQANLMYLTRAVAQPTFF